MRKLTCVTRTKIITGKEVLQRKRLFELSLNNATRLPKNRPTGIKLFKKPKGTLGYRFFSTRVIDS